MADALLRNRDYTGVQHWVAAHEVLPSAPDWLVERRAAALQRVEQFGFPGTKDEDWKYTRARPILRAPFPPALSARTSFFGRFFLDPAAPRFVLVDGQVVDGIARLGKITVASLKQAVSKGLGVHRHLGGALGDELLGFDALNTAFLVDGTYFDVPDNEVVEEPIHIVHLHSGEGRMATVRNVVRVGRNAQVTLVEHFLGHGEGFTSAVTEVIAAENAQVRHIRLQEEHVQAFHVGTVAARLARDARFLSHQVNTGGALSRVDVKVALEGPAAHAQLSGLYLLRGEQHADHHLHLDHLAPHTTSKQLFKGIVDDTAHGVFTGKVVVRPHAQHIDSDQRNNNLLLSDRAIANTRPQLEIHADDVKCAHGATVGRLDPDSLFYLRQRGLSEAQTRRLLTWAFANEVLTDLPEDATREALHARVTRWLGMDGEELA